VPFVARTSVGAPTTVRVHPADAGSQNGTHSSVHGSIRSGAASETGQYGTVAVLYPPSCVVPSWYGHAEESHADTS